MEEMFISFDAVIMGDQPYQLNQYIEKYKETEISEFCHGPEKDLVPVKHAISSNVSSGFVDGNNN